MCGDLLGLMQCCVQLTALARGVYAVSCLLAPFTSKNYRNPQKSLENTFFLKIAQCVLHCPMQCITHLGLQAQLKEQRHGRLGEAPEGCFSGLEVPLLLPGSQLVLKGHALRALPPAEAHVTHSQHNSPQGQVPGIVCLPCQSFSAALHCHAVNSAS